MEDTQTPQQQISDAEKPEVKSDPPEEVTMTPTFLAYIRPGFWD